MTVLVGVRCQDGVVIGADQAVTYGPTPDPATATLEIPQGFKISILGDQIIIATTGEVGLGQRFCKVIGDRYAARKLIDQDAVSTATEISNHAQTEFKKTTAPWDRAFGLGALIGMPLGQEPRLLYYDWQTFRPELVGERTGERFKTLPLVTMGSGAKLADPFLAHAHRALFGETHFPTVKNARLLVAWTLDHVMRFNTGGFGGDHLDIAVLEKVSGQWKASLWDAGEAAQAVDDIARHIREYPERLRAEPVRDIKRELEG